uniref:SMC family ATPase n=1 Tax=Ignisphaera aggregans TaxID=334771 RepID=A0A7C4JIT9_9CREN
MLAKIKASNSKGCYHKVKQLLGPILIRSIKLTNILSHAQTQLEFTLGLTALVGPNGAGKSSVIDSVIYALFISPQNIRGFRGANRRSFLRAGATTGSIEVELSIGGKRYIVHRVVSAVRSDEATVYEVLEDGKKRIIASGVQQVLDYIRKLLLIPSVDSVRYTVISRQNEVGRLLEEQSSTRRELILKLLGLDELEKSRDILKEHLDQINSEKKLYDELKVNLEDVRKRIRDTQLTVDQDKDELNKLEEESRNLVEIIKRYEKLLELLKKYEILSKAVEIVNELKSIEQAIPVCREIMEVNLDDYISIMVMLKERKKEIDEALKKVNEINNELKSLLTKVFEELGISIPTETLDDTSKFVEVLEDYCRKIDSEKSLRKAELSIVRNSADVITVNTRCPLCGRELDNELKNRILSDIERRAQVASADIEKLDKLYAKVRRIVEDLKKLDRRKLELKARIDNSRRYLDDYLRRYRELKDKVEKVLEHAKGIPLFAKCWSYNTNTETLKCLSKLAIEYTKVYEEKLASLKRLVGNSVPIDDIVSVYESVKRDVVNLGFDVDKFDVRKVEIEYKEFLGKFNNVREKIGKIRGRLESNIKLLGELTIEENELEKKLTNIKRAIELQPVLDLLVNKLLGKDGLLAKVLTQEARRLIEKYTNIVLKELGMDFKVKINENFEIGVYTNLGELDVRSLSGGEMVSLAIALRIALAYTVFGRLPGFFILDEPTQFLDTERRRTVFEIIRRLSEKVPQVIVVTHDPEVEELADKVFYVSKEGGRSVIREKEKFVEVFRE